MTRLEPMASRGQSQDSIAYPPGSKRQTLIFLALCIDRFGKGPVLEMHKDTPLHTNKGKKEN